MFCCVSYNLGVFWTVWLPYKTRCKIGQTSAKVRAMTSCRNFSQRTHPVVRNAPKHEFRVQWGGSGAFVAKCSCHEVASEFFATNAPDPPPLHPKLMFWCVLYHFGAFGKILLHHKSRCRTAELVQLMQTFVPWSRIVIFPNETSRSSPIYSKLIYWCILYSLASFETISLRHNSIWKTSRNLAINAKVRAKKSHRNFSQRQLPTHSNRP